MNFNWLPKNFGKNVIALYGVNFANFIIPWISVPYLVRVIGPEYYGLLAFATAVVQYSIIISDYGFNFTGPREFALIRNDQEKLSALSSSVLWTRLFLASITFCLIGLLSLILPFLHTNLFLIVLSFGSVIGGILLQTFLLQGAERFRVLSRLLLTSKIFATASIFIFVKEKQDFIYVPIIFSAGQLLAGASSIIFSIRQLGIRYSLPNFREIKAHIKSGFRVFITSGAISFYTTANTIILSVFTTPEIVGWYAAGERIVRSIQGLISPVYNVVYPHVVRLRQESKQAALIFLRKLLLPLFIFSSIGTIILIAFPNIIVRIIFGVEFGGTADVLRIMGMIPLLMSCSLVSANLFLIGFGYERQWSKIIIVTGFISLIASIGLVGGLHLQHIGASFAVLIGEILVMVSSMLYFMKEYGLLKKNVQ